MKIADELIDNIVQYYLETHSFSALSRQHSGKLKIRSGFYRRGIEFSVESTRGGRKIFIYLSPRKGD